MHTSRVYCFGNATLTHTEWLYAHSSYEYKTKHLSQQVLRNLLNQTNSAGQQHQQHQHSHSCDCTTVGNWLRLYTYYNCLRMRILPCVIADCIVYVWYISYVDHIFSFSRFHSLFAFLHFAFLHMISPSALNFASDRICASCSVQSSSMWESVCLCLSLIHCHICVLHLYARWLLCDVRRILFSPSV